MNTQMDIQYPSRMYPFYLKPVALWYRYSPWRWQRVPFFNGRLLVFLPQRASKRPKTNEYIVRYIILDKFEGYCYSKCKTKHSFDAESMGNKAGDDEMGRNPKSLLNGYILKGKRYYIFLYIECNRFPFISTSDKQTWKVIAVKS